MLLGCLNYLEASANPLTGFITEAGDGESRMHGHAYALLFLAEIFGSLPPEREDSIRQLIKGGLRVMQLAQSVDGGWYYGPEPSPREDEASITVCALQALRAARDVGFVVDANRVDRAIRYVKACQQPSGVFSYSLRMPSRTSYALTAAAMSTLNAAGVYHSPELARGFDYLRRALASASSPWDAAEEEYDFYANMYVAQALWQDGGELWDRWYTAVRDRLLSTEKSGGSWECRFGVEYATAVAILILEVPLGYLPTFQR
jgi:prenyltransferase beta subunit